MKMQKMFRISLLFWCMAVTLWTTGILVQAEETKSTAADQTVETQLQEEGVIQIEDITGLDGEFGALEEESVLIVEEVERYRKETKRKGVQKVVVLILVIAIFGVGIMTGLQEKKKNAPELTVKEGERTEEETGGQI